MNLTICLVTRGRSQFLEACLESLEGCLQAGIAKVLIFDNGSPAETSIKLANWCEKNDVECIRYRENDSRPTRVRKAINERRLTWVVFPGDDDIFIVDSLKYFKRELEANASLSAIAFNVETIDSDGRNLNRVRKPEFRAVLPKPISVAKSFHEPQFLWPSLFFRADLIVQPVPTSRFYFDWWIGQCLILNGNLTWVDECAVQYRVHPLQESHLANNRRKYFEATQWMVRLIDSSLFQTWVRDLSQSELIEFWNYLLALGPIYSSEYFSGQILQKLSSTLLELKSEPDLLPQILGAYAATKGVWLRTGELNNLTLAESPSRRPFPSNISVKAVRGSCDALLMATQEFEINSISLKTYSVSCKHSSSSHSDFMLNCDQFATFEIDQIADQVVLKLSEKAEQLGQFEFLTTGAEQSLILWLRRVKRSFPGWVLSSLKNLVGRGA